MNRTKLAFAALSLSAFALAFALSSCASAPKDATFEEKVQKTRHLEENVDEMVGGE